MGAWGLGFSKWDLNKLENSKKEKNLLNIYLNKRSTLKFPGIIFQREVEDFLDNWEIRTYWFDNKFATAVGTKHDFEIGDDYVAREKDIQSILPQLKKMGKEILDIIPKQKVGNTFVNPVMMRIDFGCCMPGTKISRWIFIK